MEIYTTQMMDLFKKLTLSAQFQLYELAKELEQKEEEPNENTQVEDPR